MNFLTPVNPIEKIGAAKAGRELRFYNSEVCPVYFTILAACLCESLSPQLPGKLTYRPQYFFLNFTGISFMFLSQHPPKMTTDSSFLLYKLLPYWSTCDHSGPLLLFVLFEDILPDIRFLFEFSLFNRFIGLLLFCQHL